MIAGMILSPRAIWAVASVVAVAALYGFGWTRGAAHVHAEWQLERAEQATALAKMAAEQAKVTTQVVTEYVDRVQVVRERGQTIIKEVPVYVPADSCDLPAGFRVHHDASAAGELPDPARIADAAPAGAAAVAETVAGNYSACHQNAEKLRALQSWVSGQASEAPK